MSWRSAARDEGGGLWATVSDVRMAGAIVKIEVIDADRRPIQVELGREQYERIRVIIGETVYVKPRRVRVFMDDGIVVRCRSPPVPVTRDLRLRTATGTPGVASRMLRMRDTHNGCISESHAADAINPFRL